jgi:hypothetical protein
MVARGAVVAGTIVVTGVLVLVGAGAGAGAVVVATAGVEGTFVASGTVVPGWVVGIGVVVAGAMDVVVAGTFPTALDVVPTPSSASSGRTTQTEPVILRCRDCTLRSYPEIGRTNETACMTTMVRGEVPVLGVLRPGNT